MANKSYKIVSTGDQIHNFSNQEADNLDLFEVTKSNLHLLHNNQGYSIQNVSVNQKTVAFTMNGRDYSFEIQDEHDQLAEKLGFDKVAKVNLSNIISPMPGLILDIMVREGQSFSEGDSLLILEAMKMENVIKAAADGVVKSINAGKGDAVEKGQILLELE